MTSQSSPWHSNTRTSFVQAFSSTSRLMALVLTATFQQAVKKQEWIRSAGLKWPFSWSRSENKADLRKAAVQRSQLQGMGLPDYPLQTIPHKRRINCVCERVMWSPVRREEEWGPMRKRTMRCKGGRGTHKDTCK